MGVCWYLMFSFESWWRMNRRTLWSHHLGQGNPASLLSSLRVVRSEKCLLDLQIRSKSDGCCQYQSVWFCSLSSSNNIHNFYTLKLLHQHFLSVNIQHSATLLSFYFINLLFYCSVYILLLCCSAILHILLLTNKIFCVSNSQVL